MVLNQKAFIKGATSRNEALERNLEGKCGSHRMCKCGLDGALAGGASVSCFNTDAAVVSSITVTMFVIRGNVEDEERVGEVHVRCSGAPSVGVTT